MKALSKELLAAYRATHFHIYSEPQFVLKIDQYSQELAAVHADFNVNCSTFITAYNPFSEQYSDEMNEKAQQLLIENVEKSGLRWIAGEGKDPENQWPGELSILVLGLNREAGVTLGREFRQNAIIYSESNAIPELVVCV